MNTDTALITGASSDLGIALIDRLLRAAPRKIIAHVNEGIGRLEALEVNHPGLIVPLRADLSVPGAVSNLADRIRSSCGLPQAIVHFAGLPLRLERASKWDSDHLWKDFTIQVDSFARLMALLLPEIVKKGERCNVVFVLSSVTLGVPPKFMSMYTVVKYAQLGLMRSLAAEYVGTQVRINSVSPSMVRTKFLSQLPEKIMEMGAAQNPTGSLLTPDNVVDSLIFLLGPGSDHLHGVNLPITDGSVF